MLKPKPAHKILVVDDDEIIRHVLTALLADFGLVEHAASGEEAIEMMATFKPEIVVLDVNMPNMDGYEVCTWIKENEDLADVPVVFLTSNTTIEDEEKALDHGAADFIPKPISSKIVRKRVSNILELHAANRELERLASTDPLTGAFNRRHFMAVGNSELHRFRRYGQSFTVLMLDIDHFKAVNDTYGHGAGDDALIATAGAIDEALRNEDTLGRLGGEEFAVILPQTEPEKAIVVAERIRAAIADISVDTEIGALSFTTSIGVTQARDGDDSIEDALSRADKALYAAKEQGRNRVISDVDI